MARPIRNREAPAPEPHLDRARRIIPNKFRLHGRDHYLRYIEKAVEAFDVGFVQSLIEFRSSIEPIEDTLDAMRALAERGCIPVLSLFRPDFTTPMGKQPPAGVDEMNGLSRNARDLQPELHRCEARAALCAVPTQHGGVPRWFGFRSVCELQGPLQMHLPRSLFDVDDLSDPAVRTILVRAGELASGAETSRPYAGRTVGLADTARAGLG